MPISLLLEGRPCLVVGGGKIAFRKAGHLLDSGALVTVVSPELCEEFSDAGVEHIARPFELSDVNGMALVFAATNDRHVNRQVLGACREKNILCSCVDGNWSKSDFTTPAIARRGNMTLAVSSGGQSCRQAKMVKNSLSKHVQMIDSAELVVVGTDHRHLDIEEREPFHLAGPRYERIGWMMTQLWGIHEFMILNTCNRVEVMAVVSRETATNGILRHILGFDRIKEDKYYIKRGADAYEHLCLMTSGMLSQTPGESHVAAQVKDALAAALKKGWANSMMQEWVSSLLHVSKHIKNEVSPLLRNEEVEDLALKYLQAHNENLQSKTLIMLGAGMIGKGLVRDAVPMVGKIIWCYHINRPEVSTHWNEQVELCTFNSIKDRLGEADLIISATEAPGYVLHSGHAPFFDQEKKISLVDLGMPRNMDPALRELSTEIELIDLDGLKYWHRNEAANMDEVFSHCRRLIAEHQEQYEQIINSFQGGDA